MCSLSEVATASRKLSEYVTATDAVTTDDDLDDNGYVDDTPAPATAAAPALSPRCPLREENDDDVVANNDIGDDYDQEETHSDHVDGDIVETDALAIAKADDDDEEEEDDIVEAVEEDEFVSDRDNDEASLENDDENENEQTATGGASSSDVCREEARNEQVLLRESELSSRKNAKMLIKPKKLHRHSESASSTTTTTTNSQAKSANANANKTNSHTSILKMQNILQESATGAGPTPASAPASTFSIQQHFLPHPHFCSPSQAKPSAKLQPQQQQQQQQMSSQNSSTSPSVSG